MEIRKLENNFDWSRAHAFIADKLGSLNIKPMTLCDVMKNSSYSMGSVCSIIVVDPEVVFSGEIADDYLNQLNKIYSVVSGALLNEIQTTRITPTYAEDDIENTYHWLLSDIAEELSNMFPNIVFAVHRVGCGYGNRENIASEDIDWHINGDDILTAMNATYATSDDVDYTETESE